MTETEGTMMTGEMEAAGRSGALDAEACWRAVQERDARADGDFVYAVRSTRIYCRPSCPARRPAPAQVRFFPTVEAAGRAGFRPCRRCRPGEAAEDARR